MGWFDGDVVPSAFEAILAADTFLGDDDRRRRRDEDKGPREAERNLEEQRKTARQEAKRLQHELSAGTAKTASDIGPQIGDLDDGGIYVGKSATNGKDLHAALADEPEYLTFEEAFEVAAKMSKQPGRENAHVPTPKELDENLYQNRNRGQLKGTFNTSGSYPGSVYRSSASYGSYVARVQWFVDGNQSTNDRSIRLPVRLVW